MASDDYGNPGYALHDLINAARRSSNSTIREAWERVLEAKVGSLAWTLRHSELVGLFALVLDQVEALPDNHRTKQRSLRHAPAWYKAVVWTDNWDSASSNLLDQDGLDQLEATADVLDGRYPRSTAPSIDRLRLELEGLEALVDETTELPSDVREQIGQQLRHVKWLLSMVDTFGPGPVVREGQRLSGQVASTVFTRLRETPKKRSWLESFGRIVFALTLFSQGVEESANIIENAHNTVSVMIEMGDELRSAFSDTPQLPAGQDEQVVDAEVVDDTTEPGPAD